MWFSKRLQNRARFPIAAARLPRDNVDHEDDELNYWETRGIGRNCIKKPKPQRRLCPVAVRAAASHHTGERITVNATDNEDSVMLYSTHARLTRRDGHLR